jgi:hypothetical protein
MLYIHSLVIFSSKIGKFIHFLENFGIGLTFSSIFHVFWFPRLGATSIFLVQFGYKLPKKFSDDKFHIKCQCTMYMGI